MLLQKNNTLANLFYFLYIKFDFFASFLPNKLLFFIDTEIPKMKIKITVLLITKTCSIQFEHEIVHHQILTHILPFHHQF